MKIIVKNTEEKVEKEFVATGKKTLISELRDNDVEIHSACMMWMCGACMCKIEKWVEFIDKSAKGEPAFPLYEDEVMTCIAKVNGKKDGEVILKKIY